MPITLLAEEPHTTLVQHCLAQRLEEFVESHARHFSFRDLCLAVGEVHSLTYDHAVDVVRRRWPQHLADLAA